MTQERERNSIAKGLIALGAANAEDQPCEKPTDIASIIQDDDNCDYAFCCEYDAWIEVMIRSNAERRSIRTNSAHRRLV